MTRAASAAWLSLVLCLLVASTSVAADDAARLKWFDEARFGMFIHWGIYSVLGRGEWVMFNEQIPIADYEPLRDQFHPDQFNADEWVALAKAAGQKYITFTSKHHDGFCMFDSKLTDYDSMDAPCRRDFCGELVAACHRQGMRICFYHSLLDWHHPDYKTDLPRYVEHAKGQLRELCTNYGKINGIWFDGGWEHSAEEWHSQELIEMIRELQPGIIVNDRAGWDGDFGTPEQTVPGAAQSGRRWESCITINGNWGYAQDDRNYKSVQDLVRLLVDVASKGGNLLLNVGPMPTGQIQPEFVERLQGVGQWVERNGESVYGTQAGALQGLPWGRSTQKGSTLYLHVFEWPRTALRLEGLKSKVQRAWLLWPGPKEPVAVGSMSGDLAPGAHVRFTQKEGLLRLHVPPDMPDPLDTVIALECDGPPEADLAIRPGADGSFVCDAVRALVHGATARLEDKGPNIGFWMDPQDWVSWEIKVPAAGSYEVSIGFACAPGTGGATYDVLVGDQKLSGTVRETGAWETFVTERLGAISLPAGTHLLKVVPTTMPGGAVMNLKGIGLTPAEPPASEP